MSELAKLGPKNAIVRTYFQPEGAFFIAQVVARSQQFLGGRNLAPGLLAGFGSGFNETSARIKAVGEFFERFLAERGYVGQNLVKLSLADKKNLGPLLDPNFIRPFHDSSWLCAKYPKITDEAISYTLGQDAYSHEPVLLPALAAFLPFVPKEQEPKFMSTSATGMAAHTDLKKAQVSALLEVMERHALMASFRLKDKVWLLDMSELPPGLLDFMDQNHFRLRLFDVGTFLPTIMAMITDQDDQKLTIGSKSGALSINTVESAIAEALSTRESLKRSQACWQPRSSFEHMAKSYHDPKPVIRFYEEKALKKSLCLEDKELGLEEILARVRPLAPIYFATLGRYGEWQAVRVLIPKAYSKEGDSFYPHLKNFCIDKNPLEVFLKLNLNPHPFG